MNKFVSLLVVLVLCLSVSAFAEAVPSKTTGDMTQIEVVAENLPADANLVIKAIAAVDPSNTAEYTAEYVEKYEALVETAQTQITKLAESESVVAYFGEVKDAEGNVIDLNEVLEVLETENLNVFEFSPFVVEGYEESYGKVTANMLFATPYEKDQKVVVLVGLVTVENDVETVEWIAFPGIGVEVENATAEQQGCIKVEFDAKTLLKIQEGNALLTVVSK